MGITRRTLLQSGALGAGAITLGTVQGCAAPPPTRFSHGVASGDPTSKGFIIWTRVDTKAGSTADTQWIVARDEALKDVVARGRAIARPIHDHCIKVDVKLPSGERPGSTYYYGFVTHDRQSPIGRTKTLPDSSAKTAAFAMASCSNYPTGYFSVYREIANLDDINFVLHLGDYIYEYGLGGYGTQRAAELDRLVQPQGEVFSLQDYRARYATYRSDPDLQAAHAKHPFIVVWDDHESANDSWIDGAQNHDPKTEGDWSVRRAAALQAYSEWMPIRLPEPDNLLRIYRDFKLGDLMHLHMLDTRLIGRARQLEYAQFRSDADGFDAQGFVRELGNPQRTLLGVHQRDWLSQNLVSSGARWQVLGQQVLMTNLSVPANLTDLQPKENPSSFWKGVQQLQGSGLPLNLDAWDGYPAARERVYGAAQRSGGSLISLAGDTHNAWASTLRNRAGQIVGTELATPSVTSSGINDYLKFTDVAEAQRRMVAHNPQLEYVDIAHRGFLLVQLSDTEAQGEFRFVDTVHSKNYSLRDDLTRRVVVRAGVGAQLRV